MEKDLILSAIRRIAVLYDGKKRKAGGDPAIVQPLQTLLFLQKDTQDTTILVAALLQGALRHQENYGYGQLRAEFGSEIAKIVEELTEYKGEPGKERQTWKERKYRPLNQFVKMSFASKKIFLVSRIVNLISLVEDYRVKGDKIWLKFNAGQEQIARYYYDFFIILTEHFHHELIHDYHDAYQTANRLFGWEKEWAKKWKK